MRKPRGIAATGAPGLLLAVVALGCAADPYITDDGRPFSESEYERTLGACAAEWHERVRSHRTLLTSRQFRDRCMRERGWVRPE